jgi:hypothetical protein
MKVSRLRCTLCRANAISVTQQMQRRWQPTADRDALAESMSSRKLLVLERKEASGLSNHLVGTRHLLAFKAAQPKVLPSAYLKVQLDPIADGVRQESPGLPSCSALPHIPI